MTAAPDQPHLGLWVATSRIQQPDPSRALVNLRKKVRSNLDSSGPNSSPSRSSSSTSGDTLPGSSLNFNKWQKPTKFACRCSPEKKNDSKSSQVKLAELGKLFLVLFESELSQEEMEMGHEGSPSPRDLYMPDASGLSLKQAKSHPRMTQMQEIMVITVHGPGAVLNEPK